MLGNSLKILTKCIFTCFSRWFVVCFFFFSFGGFFVLLCVGDLFWGWFFGVFFDRWIATGFVFGLVFWFGLGFF